MEQESYWSQTVRPSIDTSFSSCINCKISNFSLRDNGIGSDGAVALAEMMIENNYIVELDISENKIGKIGSDALFSMLLENTTLQKLG